MGRRINLATLASAEVLDTSPPRVVDVPHPTSIPVQLVASNPTNPRENLGDLGDLESMQVVGQLQPCVVVTRAAFLAVYPEHETAIEDAQYVVVAGSRRRAAAERYGLTTLDIVVRDQLAASRAQFYAAAVTENIDRKRLDVLEEAKAVQRLAQECGSGTEAGAILGKTKGWVSQRLALLKLTPQMQELLRAGELPVRDARRLAAVPPDEQLQTWRKEREQAAQSGFTAVNPLAEPHDASTPPSDVGMSPDRPVRRPRIVISSRATPREIATVLRSHLDEDTLKALAAELTTI